MAIILVIGRGHVLINSGIKYPRLFTDRKVVAEKRAKTQGDVGPDAGDLYQAMPIPVTHVSKARF